MTRIGFLGFGEAGSCFARLVAAHGAEVTVYDHNIPRQTEKAAAKAALAEEVGVAVAHSLADLGPCDVLISTVAPRTTLDAARAYAPHARAGQVYVDLNSTTPTVKTEVADILGKAEVSVIDGVLMGGGVRLDGDEVPILLAGPDSGAVAERLVELGLNVSALGEEVGAASAMKMLRSAAIKGFEAVCIEMLIAAQRYDLVEEVLDVLTRLFDQVPSRTLIEHLVQSHADHCGRRSGEVEMVRDTIALKDADTLMTSAALEVFERSARAPKPRPWDDSRSLSEVLDNLSRSMDAERRVRDGERSATGT